MKFKIGQWVQVHAKAVTVFDNKGGRTIESQKLSNPIHGQIVGATRRQEGSLRDWNENIEYFNPKPEWYLSVSETKLVWQIRRGILNKPIEAFEEDIELHVGRSDGLLNIHRYPVQYSEAYRKDMREYMKNVPRDSKGRWLKI
ncbi:hypothetical protein LCGC14_1937800 [marine sediment metagenome]|uniref:Uncharacterized protein n=1 Tax=marine sediment metagenome TaxID=412755 RepID=A0A0F9IIJ7_9ZZZZ